MSDSISRADVIEDKTLSERMRGRKIWVLCDRFDCVHNEERDDANWCCKMCIIISEEDGCEDYRRGNDG